MSDRLKLSDAKGDAEAGRVAVAQELLEDHKKIKELEKNIAALEAELAKQKRSAPATAVPTKNKIGARKQASFMAISTAPSINKTPIGPSMVPVPYPTVQDLTNSTSTAKTVNFNGSPAYLLDCSSQPSCKGDAPGTGKGVRSGTVSGEVKPVQGCRSVRIEGKQVVRDEDACTMNGGNNPGLYLTTIPSSSASPRQAVTSSNPPHESFTAVAESAVAKWAQKTSSNVYHTYQMPLEGIKGAFKGMANLPAHFAELLIYGAAEQQVAELEQAAAFQTVLGKPSTAKKMSDLVSGLREANAQINIPKFDMSNAAQEGGDTIATVAQLVLGGISAVKGIVKSAISATEAAGQLRVLGVAGKPIEKAAVTDAADVSLGMSKAAPSASASPPAAAGAGVRIVAATEKNYGVTFFGDDILPFYDASKAVVGNPNGAPSFFMPLDDAALVKNAHDAALYTGMAPSAQKAYLNGSKIYGFSFPTDGLKVAKPSAADAAAWPHFLEGGRTAVKTEGPNGGYMVTPVREYVTPGNGSLPPGATLFEIGSSGEWIPLRRW